MKIITQEEAAQLEVTKLLQLNGITDPLACTPKEIAMRLTDDLCEKYLNRFITEDPKMLELKDAVRELVYREEPVLITGPTGTGKELIARALHGNREGDFIPLNCAAITETLLESELFGHKKGSFTDAHEDRMGAFQQAGKGTVFLDEIAEMPLATQAKLLRAVQEGEVRPVGSSKSVPIYCRFIAATKHNLIDLVDKGLFREDLYARISVFELQTTGLQERPIDIQLILKHLGVPEDRRDLNDEWLKRVYRFNVRALQAYAKRIEVFGKMDYHKSRLETCSTTPADGEETPSTSEGIA